MTPERKAAEKALAEAIRQAWSDEFARTFEWGDQALREIAARVACDAIEEAIRARDLQIADLLARIRIARET